MSRTKRSKTPPQIKVAELFAGVGGFRLGLEAVEGAPYKVVWSNQWEPSTTVQHASDIYVAKWGLKGHSNKDIGKVPVTKIPDHSLLVGGFPCQDYSVARNAGDAHGIIGKKGVLWWQIHKILRRKGKKRTKYLMLENVDRLLKSPTKQRGRDFALMLSSLSKLGYIVEWRVINAADYGMPQKRRRVFIMGYKKGTPIYNRILRSKDPLGWITRSGVMANAFPVEPIKNITVVPFRLDKDLVKITSEFNSSPDKRSPFQGSGIVINGIVTSLRVTPQFEGDPIHLGHVLEDESKIPDEYFLKGSEIKRWEYLKGSKNEPRLAGNGFKFTYTEGPLPFPDPLDRPSRTIITSEGGPGPSRFKHVVKCPSGRLRRLVPVELERLNQFPDDHTKGVTDNRRAFFMGNALVVGIVTRLGDQLVKAIRQKSAAGMAQLSDQKLELVNY